MEILYISAYCVVALLIIMAIFMHRKTKDTLEITPKELRTIFMTILDELKKIEAAQANPVTATLDPAVVAQINTIAQGVAAIAAALPAPLTGTSSGSGTSILPVITGVSPASGSINGGEVITITGTGFTGATAVNFGAVAGTSVSVLSDTSITAISPAQAAGVVDITVITAAGTSAIVPADKYTLS